MKVGLVIAAYVVCGFLTFGYKINRPAPSQCPVGGVTCLHAERFDHAHGAFTAGIAWPFYWAGRAAIEVTKPQ